MKNIRQLTYLFLALSVYLFILSSSLVSANQYTAKSANIDNGQLFYTEEYQEFFENGDLAGASVIYSDSNGEKTVEKTIRFSQNATQMDYQLVNHGTGYLEGVKIEGNGLYKVYRRRGLTGDIEETPLEVPAPVVIDIGIHFFIQKHWRSLLAGELLAFHFIVPRQLDYYTMRIRKLQKLQEDAQDCIHFEVEPNSFFIRMISKLIGIRPILMIYDAQTRRIVAYQGITGVPIGDSAHYQVRTEYQYPDCN